MSKHSDWSNAELVPIPVQTSDKTPEGDVYRPPDTPCSTDQTTRYLGTIGTIVGESPLVQPIYTEGTSREAGSAGNAAPPGFREPVPTSDKTTQEYWLERIRQWATMDGNQARAELLQSTGGVMPPMYLFSEADKLAKWLTENGKQ